MSRNLKYLDLGVVNFDESYPDRLYPSLSEHYGTDDIHFYFPFIEYFSNEDEILDYDTCFNNKNRAIEILDDLEEFDENNIKFRAVIQRGTSEFDTDIVIKRSPVLNFENIMLLKKQLQKSVEQILEPSQLMVPFNKLVSYDNSTYIDTMVSYLTGRLVEKNICPHFPLFYGYCLFTEDETTVEITDDLDKLREYSWFTENESEKIYRQYKYRITTRESPEVFTDEEDSESNEESRSDEEVEYSDEQGGGGGKKSSNSTNSTNSDEEPVLKTYAIVENMPVQLKMMEYCGKDSIDDSVEFTEKQWESILFQVMFTLHVAWIYYKLTHNDLHLGNILFQKTNLDYLYYLIDGRYYRIPTYGHIVKIIDWNRATFKLNDTLFSNECFDRDGPCYKQFVFPEKFYRSNKTLLPTECSDLALLAASIIDEDNMPKNSKIYELVRSWCTNEDNICVPNKYKGFSMYEKCSQCTRSNPQKMFNQSLFSKYQVRKERVPKDVTIYKN